MGKGWGETMIERHLRIGLICPKSDELEPWVLRLAERICTTPGLSLCALIFDPADASPKTRSALGPWWTLEAKLTARAKPAHCPGFDTIHDDLPMLVATDHEAIKALAPDVLLDLTALRGQSIEADLAPFGVWFLDFIRPVIGADSIHAILSRERLIDINLCRTALGGAKPRVLATAKLNTKFIAALNHLYICEKAVTLILRELKRVQINGQVASVDHIEPSEPKSLSPITILRYGLHLIKDVFTRIGQKAANKLGLRPGMFYLQTSTGDPMSFNPAAMVEQPIAGNRYYADPFLWAHDGETYCFFEIYDYETLHGHIGVAKLESGILMDVRSIIKNDYHMSYPFLFEEDGELYMLPETCGANRIEIWKCVDFPYGWERDRVVLEDVVAADSSIIQLEDEWWLFTNISTDPFGEMNSELHLYKIDGPGLTQLEAHPLNPVVFDARTARNGGRVLNQNGEMYRASQNNSHGLYGYGLNLMRIDTLSMTEYTESFARQIEPDFLPGLIGCHHIDNRDGFIVIDVRKRIGGRAS